MNRLPIYEVLDDIVSAVASENPVVLKAPPGAGKTSIVPMEMVKQELIVDGQLLLIQPRRMAARAAARRLASHLSCRLGETVGYHVRFDRKVSPATRLVAMTPGILLRKLQSDPLLENVSCVVLDEFHERSLELDLALGMLHRIRTTLRPELKLVVMSATLDPEPIAQFLGDAVSIVSQGRSHPVQVQYQELAREATLEHGVVDAVSNLIEQTSGDILVFLPGVGEIRRCESALQSFTHSHDLVLHQLYGSLAPERQDTVLAPSQQRKLILATNVAETSITIDGVTGVIDTGLARVMHFETRLGLPRLQLQPISQASAEQRSGRAGRTAAGIAIRLWARASHSSRAKADSPEVLRTDLAGAVLTLHRWGEHEVGDFPWLTPPHQEAIDLANHQLQQLSAIDDRGRLSPLGEQMVELPLPPRLSRFLLAANESSCRKHAALLAALLSERSPFNDKRLGWFEQLERLLAWQEAGERRSDPAIDFAAGRTICRTAKQFLRMLPDPKNDPFDPTFIEDRLAMGLLQAYPDRIARRRTADSDHVGAQDRAIMVGGRGLRLRQGVLAPDCEFFLAIDVDFGQGESPVRIAVALNRSWIERIDITKRTEHFFDPKLGAVVARQRQYIDDLLISESPCRCEPSERAASLLLEAAREQLGGTFSILSKDAREFARRIRLIHRVLEATDLPDLDEQALHGVLLEACLTRTKLSELDSAPWLAFVKNRYDYRQLCDVEELAPATMKVPSGNSIKVDYREEKPVMRVRIQEIFGWKATPRIVRGRVPVQLHLLGPNHRPQQITEDLTNFWSETYHHVRKELRRRYPKHHWPEDPTSATATRNGLKPRS